MKVLVVLPERVPFVKNIGASLESLRDEVGGNIQAIYPFAECNACIVCNDEGKLLGLPLNRALRDEEGTVYDIISGKFLVVGVGEENFTDLDQEQLFKYAEMFEAPEMFVSRNGVWEVLTPKDIAEKCDEIIEHYYDDEYER